VSATSAVERHRDALVAELCRGLRVADSPADPGEADVVTVLDGLDDGLLDALEPLVASGTRLVLWIENRRVLGDADGAGPLEARRAFERFGGAEVVALHAAEGSLMLGEGSPGEARLVAVEEAEPEYAAGFLAAIGFDAGSLAAASGALRAVAGPAPSRRLLDLERANDELRRTNARLSRSWLGRTDAAAATFFHRYTNEVEELRAELERRGRRIDELEEVALRNDRLYQQEVAWHDAARYDAVDWLFAVFNRIPGASAAARFFGRLVVRARRSGD
jgi:hypothetical protein